MFVKLAMALSVPSRSVTSYSVSELSPDPVDTVAAVPAKLALTSGSTMMSRSAVDGDPECPVAKLTVVWNVTVVPPLCCPDDRLNVFDMSTPVSPADPDPTLITWLPAPSPKFQVYVLEPELLPNMDCAPGLVAVSLLNVTGNPEVASSLMPLMVEPSTDIAAVCAEYTKKRLVDDVAGMTAGLADACVSILNTGE